MIKFTERMDRSQYFGTTEAGEISFDLSVFDRLYNGNIIITKRITDKLSEKLIEHKDKIILHCTCTGYGGTVVEPFVPDYETTYRKLSELIMNGFPVSHIVLRVDPVIPTEKGIKLAIKVIEKFLPLGITRVRWSCLDMYDHVKKRFIDKGLKLPYDTFNADKKTINDVHNLLMSVCETFNATLETCGEYGYESTPCLSQKDVDILGLTGTITLEGKKGQRGSCCCPKNKKELITGKKPSQCKNSCLYCYWKGENEC